MRFGKYLVAAAAASMAIAPAFAAPVNPASSLSVAKSVRAGSASGKQKLEGSGIVIAVVAAAAVVAGIIIIADDNNDSDSN